MSGLQVSHGAHRDAGLRALVFPIDLPVVVLKPLGPLFFLVRIVGEDQLDAGSMARHNTAVDKEVEVSKSRICTL